MSNLVTTNKIALWVVAAIVVSTLLIYQEIVGCSVLVAFVELNFIAIPLAAIIALVGLIQTFISKQADRVVGVACFILVLVLCAVVGAVNLMFGIGLGHGGC